MTERETSFNADERAGQGFPSKDSISKESQISTGQAFRTLRLHLGLSQERLADRIGGTQHHISKIEHDLAAPSWDFVIRLYAIASQDEMHSLSESMEQQVAPVKRRNDLVRSAKGALATFEGLVNSGLVPEEARAVLHAFLTDWQPIVKGLADGRISDQLRNNFERS